MYKLGNETNCIVFEKINLIASGVQPSEVVIYVSVTANDFSGKSTCSCSLSEFCLFLMKTKDVYNELSGEANLIDMLGNTFRIQAGRLGQLTVVGEIGKASYNFDAFNQSMRMSFKFDITQLELKRFIYPLAEEYEEYMRDMP